MEEKTTQCPICGVATPYYLNYDRDLVSYHCPVCGRYQLGAHWKERNHFDMNHLAAFLAHNAFEPKNDFENRYYTTVSKEVCDELQKEGCGHPVHIDSETVEAWYPRSFAEKIDRILLYLYKHAPHIGQTVRFSQQALYSSLFIERYESSSGKATLRLDNDLRQEGNYVLNCLAEQGYIQNYIGMSCDKEPPITLMPAAYARIDEIQKNTANGRNVLVAMSFQNTKKLNESRFSNNFIEKRDLSYPESLVIRGFPLFYIKMPSFQNSLNAKLIFLHVASI